LIYSTRIEASHLWRTPIGTGSKGPAVPFLPSTRLDWFPLFSPDGKRVAFESARSGNHEIWVCNEHGSAPVQLTFLGAWSGTPRWSPDGEKLAFDSNSTGNWDIFVVSSRGGKPVQMTSNRADDFIASWSQDGKWIYFTSRRTGRYEIWKIPVAGGDEIQMTKNGGMNALEAEGGKALYFARGGLWRMALADGAEEQLTGPFRGLFEPCVRGVYFVQRSFNETTLKFLPYGSRSVSTVLSLGTADITGIAISPDERYALFSRDDVTNSELMLVEDFGRKHGP
jgi:dipeptidyl aminopeptidase/acylaminoacyl peptidase